MKAFSFSSSSFFTLYSDGSSFRVVFRAGVAIIGGT
jgi:hypothetical protein